MGAVVETRYGRIEGFESEGLQVFRGIPFAMPPLGELRFRSPEAPEPWSGVRSAGEFGASAPQRPLPIPLLPGWDVGRQDEDCLFLNVTTPAADEGRRPVMVWLHGGGFAMGSGSQSIYDPGPLARRGDVVVVTVNYRLGPLGFLHLDDLLGESFGASGNAGVEDQIAALRWVRDNVAAFGGDPDRVTVFGESAGAMSVATLLGTPAARGLFCGAVAQSGAAHNVHTRESANRVAELVLDSLGMGPGEANRLRAVDTEALLKAHDAAVVQEIRRPGGGLLPFQPVIDGKLLARPPLELIAEGLSADVALLAGTNRDEWNLFGVLDPRRSSLDEATVRRRLEASVGDGAARVLAAYRSARGGAGAPTPRELFFALQTDRVFRMPALRLSEAQSRHQPRTYHYLFTWESPSSALGACHGIDIPFVFGLVDREEGAQFSGSGPDAKALAERTMDAWLSFARSGEPGHEGLGAWPAFDTERRSTMLLGATCEIVEAPFDAERRAWDGLI